MTIDVTVWVYQSHSYAIAILLGVSELFLNYELDKVLCVSLCQARLAVLVSCRAVLTMTGPVSCVYLGVPVNILPSDVSKKGDYRRACIYVLQIYLQLWLRERSATPLRTRVIRYLQYDLSLGIRCETVSRKS